MKKRVLSGIQPSGKLHIGNYFAMIKRMVEYQDSSDLFCFIANLHSLTTVQNKNELKSLTIEAAMDMLALGIDPEKSHFWVQSDVPEVAELTWILSCVTPMGIIQRATSYKDKITRGVEPNLGLFSYPALMTADILINQSELVPVGRDQKQHLEIARDIAAKFNNKFGEVFRIPEPDILKDVATVPGTDGLKMSKSYNNTIPIFAEDSVIKKSVMGIVTDSKAVEEVKDPEKDNVFAIYKLFANEDEQNDMADRYKKGGLGYGDAKKELLSKINDHFGDFRIRRRELESNPDKVEAILEKGAVKVRKISSETLDKVRQATGLKY